MNTDIHR